jgi:hypothetical protein
MKTIKLLSSACIFLSLLSCDAVKQATNTTGGAVFSLNGKWKLMSNIPENSLVNSTITVAPFLSQGLLASVENNTQCYRINDIKWKNIKVDKIGGYSIENAANNCATGSLTYIASTISIVNNNEIKVTGKNALGQDNVELWSRIK